MEITWMQRYGSGAVRRMLSSSSSINSRKCVPHVEASCLQLEKAEEGLKGKQLYLAGSFQISGCTIRSSLVAKAERAAEASTRKLQNISHNGSHFGEDTGHREMLYTPSSCPFLRAILENGTSQRKNHIESKLLIPFSIIIIIIKISLSLLHLNSDLDLDSSAGNGRAVLKNSQKIVPRQQNGERHQKLNGTTFAGLAGGNSALALAMTILSSLLGVLIVPFSISKLAGKVGASVPADKMFKSLIVTVLIPLIMGKVFRDFVKGDLRACILLEVKNLKKK
ncbi:probable sodium/metabolite cotransporter BASS4, chloroplastic [Tanacetum coccineum]